MSPCTPCGPEGPAGPGGPSLHFCSLLIKIYKRMNNYKTKTRDIVNVSVYLTGQQTGPHERKYIRFFHLHT